MSRLSENIRLLGDLLGDVIRRQAGDEVFDVEERIRALSKRWRGGDESANYEIANIIHKIIDDLPLTSEILKAFTTYFQLVNLAEEHERIRILNLRANQSFNDQQPMDESIAASISQLKKELTADEVRGLLAEMMVMPVFTAHPTESRRRTTLKTLDHLSEHLTAWSSASTLEFEQPEIREELSDTIALLWQSDERRKRRPTVMDEVRNTGLYFFETTLFDVVPRVFEELEQAVSHCYPEIENVPTVLRFGSWIGGDRDGNPLVSVQTTEQAIRAHSECVLSRYLQDVYKLYETLSISRRRASFDPKFLEQLENEIESLAPDEQQTLVRFVEEPYRQKLILIYRRLLATRQRNQLDWDESRDVPRAYSGPDQLLADLHSIHCSLSENKGESIARGTLSRLIRRVQVFGFHLASLDIRQHSGRHEQALTEIFENAGSSIKYDELTDDDRVELLSREISQSTVSLAPSFSDPTNETIELLRLVKQAHTRAGKQSVESYVISMTESVSDVLEVLLLMSDAELFGQLDLVPLFETIDDLRSAPQIMTRLFENEVYRRHLRERGDRQQIMIGYSDSNKDGGFLAANWMLFTAQRQLAAVCSDHKIGLTLFHGRGGSIGRGGGPANRAILAQPPESIRGRLRLTEQGEVVSSRYNHSAIAQRHLQQLLHAVICSTTHRRDPELIERWSQVMDRLSELAFGKYRQLVELPVFIDYFHAATPIDQIGQLNLGSRPAKRRATEGIADLRAIPWVFAWTQSRTALPSWYGAGTAFRNWLAEDSTGDRLRELQAMYHGWPFFRTMINNIHVGLGRADMPISQLYSQLADDSDCRAIFGMIEEEFQLTRDLVLQISQQDQILDTEPWLQHSIRVRNPYVDPMNYVQIALLERFRNSADDQEREQIQNVLLQTINGIAAGLQNVG